LGGPICDLIEERAVFGPGSLKGEPARLDDEKRALIWKMYEVYPKGHELAGRRRFRRVRIELRKGSAKTELGAWVCYAELHPDGLTRFDGWRKRGRLWEPVGRPVRDPYIPMLAFTKEQVDELAFNVLLTVCTEGPDSDLFSVSTERIIRLSPRGTADGKAVGLASSPNARDGARTTLNFYDETHRLVRDAQRAAYETMEANLPKRGVMDDPWSLGTTTAGVPGEKSVAEIDKDEAEAILRGEVTEPEMLYFRRFASADHDLVTLEGRMAAITEASGPAVAAWSDIRGIAKQWDRPGADIPYLEQVWLNRWTQASLQAFDVKAWDEYSTTGEVTKDGTPISLGLDGSRWKDKTGIVATDLASRRQWKVACWSPSEDDPVDIEEVRTVLQGAFAKYWVTRLYGDPALGYDRLMAELAGEFGPRRVTMFETDARGRRRTAFMCRRYASAITSGELHGDGDREMRAHLAAAYKRDAKIVDDEGQPLWVMAKERHDSPNKIDLAMAGALSWQAALDSIAAGEADHRPYTAVYLPVRR
jgi:hypothetical protein